MVPIKQASAAFILIWSLIPSLAVSESTSPGSVDVKTVTRPEPSRGPDDAGLDLRAEHASGDGQSQESANPPGSNKGQEEAPSLGLCDGS
jgi:hypothetical protein